MLEENFERFFSHMANREQPAKKGYKVENLKHISLKMINQAARGKGRIVVFGDKDPDGIFSSMIIKVYLEQLMLIFQKNSFERGEIGVDIRYSEREKDGFGLSEATYQALSSTYALVITTDNGTSSDFHSFSINNLIVIDHHPLNDGEKLPTDLLYILNPNIWRKDGLEYSTSGGMVAYDVVRFIDKVLREQNGHYQNYLKHPDNHHSHELMLEVLKEYASFTLLSDMAILDRNNRRFVVEALKTASLKSDRIPLYSLFENEFSQQKFSFGIAPKINIDRMGELHTINPDTGLTYMESFIRPKKLSEFTQAKDFILSVDKKRKDFLRESIYQQARELDEDNDVHLVLIDKEGAKIGMGGLIAGKISQKYGKPSIVAIPTSNKEKLSFSARGENVKRILSSIIPHAGGHKNACGGSCEVKGSVAGTFGAVQDRLALISEIPQKKNLALLHEPIKPLTWKECVGVLDRYSDLAEGVEVMRDFHVAVKNPAVHAYNIYASGWGSVSFGDKAKSKKMIFDSFEYDIEDIKKAEVIVFKLNANGDLSIASLFHDTDAYLSQTVQLEEAKEFNLNSAVNDIALSSAPRVESASMKHLCTSDIIAENIFYYKEEGILFENIIEDGLVIVPSYIQKRHPLAKREDVLEFFVGENENTALNSRDMATAYSEFAKRLLITAKTKNAVFMPEGMLNHELISDQAKAVIKKIIASISKTGGANEDPENNIDSACSPLVS